MFIDIPAWRDGKLETSAAQMDAIKQNCGCEPLEPHRQPLWLCAWQTQNLVNMRIGGKKWLYLSLDNHRKPRVRVYGLEGAKQRGCENDISKSVQPEHDEREWLPVLAAVPHVTRKKRRQNIASKVGSRTEKNRGGNVILQAITTAVAVVRPAAEAIS